MKKAQITIFAVLAIIMLFAFGFIYYLVNIDSENDFTKDKQNIQAAKLTKAEIEEKISSCMYEGSVNALKLLGQQGGVYYENQRINTIYGDFYLDGLESNAGLGLNDANGWVISIDGKGNFTNYFQRRDLESYDGTDIYTTRKYFTPSEYPCRSQVQSILLSEDKIRDMPHCIADYTLEKSTEAISSQLDWPNLCNRNIPEGCDDNCICKCKGEYCKRSVMNELEDYVSKYFELCFTNYSTPGYNNSYRSGVDNNITSYIGLSNLYFVLKSQINFTSQQKDAILIFKDIKSKDIHLKLAGFFNDEFANMINKEGVIPNYNLTDKLKYYKSFSSLDLEVLPLYIKKNENPDKYDIMKLTLDGVDGNLKGKPFVFNFLRENRYPVLQNIRKIQIPGDTKKFNITFRSADPDEDKRIILWDLMNTAKEIGSPVQDKYDVDTKTYYFKSKLGTGETGSIRLSICDAVGLCDYQIISVRQN